MCCLLNSVDPIKDLKKKEIFTGLLHKGRSVLNNGSLKNKPNSV